MEEGEVDACNTSLVLGLGRGDFVARSSSDQQRKRPVQFHLLFPPSSDEYEEESGGRTSFSHDKTVTRKKLKLTKEQSTLLEESFKEHNTLTQVKKQQLAEQLKLKPRQVEVWFQNRRARTKLKQTEVDYEILKRSWESLRNENRRLKKELQELRSIKLGSPFYLDLPKVGPGTTVTMCPSCEPTEATMMNGGKIVKTEFLSSMKDSSMACYENC